jgi:hypothetical protein
MRNFPGTSGNHFRRTECDLQQSEGSAFLPADSYAVRKLRLFQNGLGRSSFYKSEQ